MSHSFAGHPAGTAGVALLLLRISTGLTPLATYLHVGTTPANRWLPIALIAAGALLGLGVGTRVIALVAAIAAVIAGLCMGGSRAALVTLEGLSLVAVALLGAGAYSIDARLYGRRVINLR